MCGSWMLACVLAAPLGARADEATENAVARYREALELEAAGDRARAAEAYAQVLRLDPEHRAARRALGYERVNGEWLTGEALRRARELEAVPAGAQARVSEALRAKARIAPLADAPPEASDPRAVALLRRALGDAEARERAAAVLELKALALPGTSATLVRALRASESTTRVRAAEALGLLGDAATIHALIARWEGRSGSGPRAHFAQTSQRSYISDFDVEVA